MNKDIQNIHIRSIEERKTYTDKTVYEYTNGKNYCEDEYVSRNHQVIVTFSDHEIKVYPFYHYSSEAYYFQCLIGTILLRLGDGLIEIPEGLKKRVSDLYDTFHIKEKLKEIYGG